MLQGTFETGRSPVSQGLRHHRLTDATSNTLSCPAVTAPRRAGVYSHEAELCLQATSRAVAHEPATNQQDRIQLGRYRQEIDTVVALRLRDASRVCEENTARNKTTCHERAALFGLSLWARCTMTHNGQLANRLMQLQSKSKSRSSSVCSKINLQCSAVNAHPRQIQQTTTFAQRLSLKSRGHPNEYRF